MRVGRCPRWRPGIQIPVVLNSDSSSNLYISVQAEVIRSRLIGALLHVPATRVQGGQFPPLSRFVPRAGF